VRLTAAAAAASRVYFSVLMIYEQSGSHRLLVGRSC
jgi:hypothetical protein